MTAPLYTTEILRLAASLAPPAQLSDPHGSADLRSPTCGSRCSTQVLLGEDGRILAVSQAVQACAFGQASAALVQQSAIGRGRGDIDAALGALQAWLGGDDEAPGRWPGFDALAPARSRTGRHGAILLPLRALKAALDSAP